MWDFLYDLETPGICSREFRRTAPAAGMTGPGRARRQGSRVWCTRNSAPIPPLLAREKPARAGFSAGGGPRSLRPRPRRSLREAAATSAGGAIDQPANRVIRSVETLGDAKYWGFADSAQAILEACETGKLLCSRSLACVPARNRETSLPVPANLGELRSGALQGRRARPQPVLVITRQELQLVGHRADVLPDQEAVDAVKKTPAMRLLIHHHGSGQDQRMNDRKTTHGPTLDVNGGARAVHGLQVIHDSRLAAVAVVDNSVRRGMPFSSVNLPYSSGQNSA